MKRDECDTNYCDVKNLKMRVVSLVTCEKKKEKEKKCNRVGFDEITKILNKKMTETSKTVVGGTVFT